MTLRLVELEPIPKFRKKNSPIFKDKTKLIMQASLFEAMAMTLLDKPKECSASNVLGKVDLEREPSQTVMQPTDPFPQKSLVAADPTTFYIDAAFFAKLHARVRPKCTDETQMKTYFCTTAASYVYHAVALLVSARALRCVGLSGCFGQPCLPFLDHFSCSAFTSVSSPSIPY